jgi:plastocyanin
MKKIIQLAIVILTIGLIFSACKKDEDKNDNPGTNEVFIQNMAFNPSTITVAPNTTIAWTNKESTTHTVTSNNGTFNSGNLGKDSKFTFTFDSAGTYNYHCSIHPSMTAKVIVQ